MKHTYSGKKGFTLIELLLFLALFTIILGVLTNLFSVIVDTQSDVESTSVVENDSKFITTRLMYDIQRASSITTPSSLGAQGSALDLVIDGVTYQYNLVNDNLQLTANSETNNLNSSLTKLTNLTFQRMGNTGGKHALRINFTIESRNTTAAGQESKDIETMVGLR